MKKTVSKEDRIKRQILTNTRKGLAAHAEKRFKETGTYKEPTREEIKAECSRRWQKHLDSQKPKEDLSLFFD